MTIDAPRWFTLVQRVNYEVPSTTVFKRTKKNCGIFGFFKWKSAGFAEVAGGATARFGTFKTIPPQQAFSG